MNYVDREYGETMKACVYCKEELKDDAHFCRKCNHYQSRWKNWVPHIGGAIALLVFIGPIFGYIIKPVRDYYKNITWKDRVNVVTFSSNSGVTVKNSGDGEVFLDTVTYRLKDSYLFGAMEIFSPVENGKFFTHRNNRSVNGHVVKKGQLYNKDDVVHVFCSYDDSAFKIFKHSLKEQILTFSCETEINYYSLNDKNRKSVDIPCVSYLLTRMSPDKSNKIGEE